MAHDAGAARKVQKLTMKADQAARRHAVVEAHAAFAIGLHIDHLSAAGAQVFHDRALVLLFHIHDQIFERFFALTGLGVDAHFWLGPRYR